MTAYRRDDSELREKVEADFAGLHARLRELERTYNPQDENLHFEALVRADAELYSALLEIAREGLAKVRRHHAFFSGSRHELYDDGMFWYDLCLFTSAAGLRVLNDEVKQPISPKAVKSLIKILIETSEYATNGNDMTKRLHEALGDTLLAFYSDELIALARKKSIEMGLEPVEEFVDWTISRVETVRKENTADSPPSDETSCP